jgi:hypothetical protein
MTTRHAPTRRGDPWTSYLAAGGVDVATQRVRVFVILNELGPLTDEEMVAEHDRRVRTLGWRTASASGLRSRRAELTHDGFVQPVEDPNARTVLGGVTLRWQVNPALPPVQTRQGVLW